MPSITERFDGQTTAFALQGSTGCKALLARPNVDWEVEAEPHDPQSDGRDREDCKDRRGCNLAKRAAPDASRRVGQAGLGVAPGAQAQRTRARGGSRPVTGFGAAPTRNKPHPAAGPVTAPCPGLRG